MTYDRNWICWLDFCNFSEIDPLQLNTNLAANFICWLYRHAIVSSGTQASKVLTGVTSTLLNFNIIWFRTRYVRELINGFIRLRPPIRKPKRPWSIYHNQLLYNYVFIPNKSDFFILSLCSMIFLAYGGLLRPSEVSKRQFSPTLMRNQINFHPSFKKPTELILILFSSKTNKINKQERIIIPCLCKTKIAQAWCPCPVHHMKYYVSIRDKSFPKNGPLFPKNLGKRKGQPITYYILSKFLKSAIITFNSKCNLNLNPNHYTPHVIRIGSTTDLVRHGYAAHYIQNRGRWLSQMWKSIYINLTWDDISLISGKSITYLISQVAHT